MEALAPIILPIPSEFRIKLLSLRALWDQYALGALCLEPCLALRFTRLYTPTFQTAERKQLAVIT